MKKNLMSIILSGLLILLTGSAWAHSDEYLENVKAPHGGQVRMAGPYHFELVAKDGELRLYVTDHMDHEILTKGGSGKANIFDKDGKKISISLIPVFANFMKGTGEFSVTPETVISVFVVLNNSETQSARFTPLAVKGSADVSESHDHHHHGEDAEHEHEHDQEKPENIEENQSEGGEVHQH
ncbi:hypothetical protein [Nitrosomonas sp.]|uniref:hypothetical protein n=1 Tax=Nitrosomonas sp. TaxID=42353 RepID=UPI0025EB3BDF|nr:hypothetical protein [Nitrosomonas sp.]